MPTQAERQRNNVRAGVFVLFTIIAAIAVIAVLGDWYDRVFMPTSQHTVQFKIGSGVSRLSPGSEVYVGGVPMGKVVDVMPRFEEDPIETIEVDFSLDQRVQLYAGATVAVGASLIGSEAWLTISSVGAKESGPIQGPLAGAEAISMLETVLGTEAAADARAIVTDARMTVEGIREHWEQVLEPAIGPSAEHVAKMIADLSKDWPNWLSEVNDTLEWLEGAEGEIDVILGDAKGAMASANRLIDTNSPVITDTIADVGEAADDVAEITKRFNEDRVIEAFQKRIFDFVDSAEAVVMEAGATVEQLHTSVDGWTPKIDETLANAMLASQQAKLTLVEVRRSPWKVLYQPTPDELKYEKLYDAARSFALAVADLKGSSATIDRILTEHGDRLNADDETLQSLTNRFVDSLDRYTEAQEDLLNALHADLP